MFAIVKTGGKQYRVQEGDVIEVEKLTADVDSDVVFDEVLAVFKDGELTAGKPLVEGARAVGRVLEHAKKDKVLVFKFKPKKKYRKLRGHRQPYTRVRIEAIEACTAPTMILCQVFRDSDHAVVGYRVSGHALFEDVGKDIVCAAVAALAQTTVIGLEEYLGLSPEVSIESGYLDCRLTGDYQGAVRGQAQAIMETMILGLESIAASYPENVRVEDADPAQRIRKEFS